MIYLDNAATTKICDEAQRAVNEINTDFYANPSSMHTLGYMAEKKLRQAKEILMKTIGAKSGDFIFTSGGTESNNQAFFGVLKNKIKRHPHIITTKIEHPSVLECAKFLEELGCEVTYVAPDENGVISAESVTDAIKENTALVSVMAVNNETGAIAPIEQITKAVKSKNKDIIVHTDCVQALSNIKIEATRWGVDLLSVSAHKVCGPKGVGGLYVSDKVKLLPLILGGHQQKNLRSGTQDVAGAYGFSAACEVFGKNMDEKHQKYITLKQLLTDNLPDFISVNNNGDMYSPHVVSLRVKNVRAEVLLHALETEGICISAGSACSTNKPAPSHVLLAQGFDRKHIEETIRVSFGPYNTEDEIKTFCACLTKHATALARFTRA